MEVAEQFVSLNDISSKFPIAGVINAPALLASRNSDNIGWMKLAELLGRIVSRLLTKQTLKGTNVVISLIGEYSSCSYKRYVLNFFLILCSSSTL